MQTEACALLFALAGTPCCCPCPISNQNRNFYNFTCRSANGTRLLHSRACPGSFYLYFAFFQTFFGFCFIKYFCIELNIFLFFKNKLSLFLFNFNFLIFTLKIAVFAVCRHPKKKCPLSHQVAFPLTKPFLICYHTDIPFINSKKVGSWE